MELSIEEGVAFIDKFEVVDDVRCLIIVSFVMMNITISRLKNISSQDLSMGQNTNGYQYALSVIPDLILCLIMMQGICCTG